MYHPHFAAMPELQPIELRWTSSTRSAWAALPVAVSSSALASASMRSAAGAQDWFGHTVSTTALALRPSICAWVTSTLTTRSARAFAESSAASWAAVVDSSPDQRFAQ